MLDFISQNIACIILCAIGLLFVIMTYGAHFAGVSGVPLVGGLFIAIGFLTTPVKWLALLGLIDPGYWSLPYFLIRDHIRNKRFDALYAQHDYAESKRADTEQLRIWIPDRNEELILPYITCHMYQLQIPKLLFTVCIDKAGRRFMLINKCIKGGEIEILPLDDDRIVFTDLKAKDADMTVEIEIVNKEEIDRE